MRSDKLQLDPALDRLRKQAQKRADEFGIKSFGEKLSQMVIHLSNLKPDTNKWKAEPDL